MHLTNVMVSPAVAGVFGVVAAGALALAARQVRSSGDAAALRPMAVLGALVFALQMVNVAIPGTGSSGHVGGGVLLAMLLGPHAGLLVMAAVLVVQAACFGDGGLIALGANLVNLGVLPCLVVALVARAGLARSALTTVVACTLAAQLGALGVVVQVGLSGTAAPVALAASMLPIHLPVGLAEGLFTAAAVLGLQRAQRTGSFGATPLWGAIAAAAIAIGGVLTGFASPLPDGLQWSLAQALSSSAPAATAAWPQVDAATSAAGVAGVLTTLALVAAMARALQPRRSRRAVR